MGWGRRLLGWGAAGLLCAALASPRPADAAEIRVPSGGAHLASALASAAPGDVLILEAGIHRGPAVIDKPDLTLQGEEGAVVDGGGRGRVVEVAASGATVRGLALRNSGMDFETVDAGVFVGKAGDGALIEGNRLSGNLFGIYLHGPEPAVVRNNHIVGSRNRRMNDRGNGIHIWNSPGTVVEGNHIRFGRDGIFATTSKRNVFRGNHFRDLRFAIHYMYVNDSIIEGNHSTNNHAAYALMYSRRLEVRNNLSEGDRDHGLLFNYANSSRIKGNTVRNGRGKCVFLYNSNKNRLHGNRFEGCDTGIHFTAGSERNLFAGNAFIDNRNQVKYVGTRHLEWSHEGCGNYWSDNPSFDLDGDGLSDLPYRPNDVVDQVVWRHPLAKFLLASPAVRIMRWSQARFPSLYPGGVVDSAPLMSPPPAAAADGAECGV